MRIETPKTLVAVAKILHEQETCGHGDQVPHGVDDCWHREEVLRRAGFFLARIMPTLSAELGPAYRADERDKIRYYIEAELVCCDIHARLEAEAAKGHWDDVKHMYVMPESWGKLRHSHDYHDICHYGGWAAQLAAEGPKVDGRIPTYRCLQNGGVDRCKPLYFCPVSGEMESPCHGGFDTCCASPEYHREKR